MIVYTIEETLYGMKQMMKVVLLFVLFLHVVVQDTISYRKIITDWKLIVDKQSDSSHGYLKIGRPRLASAEDISSTFTSFEALLFRRFSAAVAKEIDYSQSIPNSYRDLISMINLLTFTSNSSEVVNERSKRMLVNLFPPGLLPAYKILFGPLRTLSGIMNTWVTHWTTTWLMGPSKVESYVIETTGEIRKDQRVVVEKCRFLETSGCIQVCLHACKIPTQRFFYEELNLPVTLTPNLTDYSCKFDFNQVPIKLEEDLSLRHPCLADCQLTTRKSCNSQTTF